MFYWPCHCNLTFQCLSYHIFNCAGGKKCFVAILTPDPEQTRQRWQLMARWQMTEAVTTDDSTFKNAQHTFSDLCVHNSSIKMCVHATEKVGCLCNSRSAAVHTNTKEKNSWFASHHQCSPCFTLFSPVFLTLTLFSLCMQVFSSVCVCPRCVGVAYFLLAPGWPPHLLTTISSAAASGLSCPHHHTLLHLLLCHPLSGCSVFASSTYLFVFFNFCFVLSSIIPLLISGANMASVKSEPARHSTWLWLQLPVCLLCSFHHHLSQHPNKL